MIINMLKKIMCIFLYFFYTEPLRFKFCSCITVVGCTCETREYIGDGSNNDSTMNSSLDIFSFPAERVASQLTLIDAVRITFVFSFVNWTFLLYFYSLKALLTPVQVYFFLKILIGFVIVFTFFNCSLSR